MADQEFGSRLPGLDSMNGIKMQKFYDLNFEHLASGTIRLRQEAYGDDAEIDLHPEQILFVARRLCGMRHETAAMVAELERRISVLTDKLQNIVCDSSLRSDILERISGFEYLAKLDGLLDLALEFDGGRLTPERLTKNEPEAASASKPTGPCADTDLGKKTQQSAIAAPSKESFNLLIQEQQQ